MRTTATAGVHTINNAALVVMGLMLGADDYERGITATFVLVGTPIVPLLP